jgi:hypothetical protein
MLFCDTFQRSLDDLPALNVAWYRWTARVCFTCYLPLTILKQNVMRIVGVCHAWISRSASSSGELLSCVWRRAEGVNLFMTWGFVTIQACLFCWDIRIFVSHLLAIFWRNASPEIKFCISSAKILQMKNVRLKLLVKQCQTTTLLTRYRLYQRDVSVYSFNQQIHTIVIWFAIIFLKTFTLPQETCALLGNYAAYRGNSIPTFRETLLVPSSRVKNPWPLKMGPIGFPETSVWIYHYTPRNFPEERTSHLLRGRSLK